MRLPLTSHVWHRMHTHLVATVTAGDVQRYETVCLTQEFNPRLTDVFTEAHT